MHAHQKGVRGATQPESSYGSFCTCYDLRMTCNTRWKALRRALGPRSWRAMISEGIELARLGWKCGGWPPGSGLLIRTSSAKGSGCPPPGATCFLALAGI